VTSQKCNQMMKNKTLKVTAIVFSKYIYIYIYRFMKNSC
jgi:hypothetical protein